MNRRDFLKRALTVAALASVSGVVAKEGKDGDKSSEGKGRPITRRRYKDTALTLPLLGFGNVLWQGVKEAVDQNGFIGIFMGGFKAGAVGISAALIFGYIASFIFDPKMKK